MDYFDLPPPPPQKKKNTSMSKESSIHSRETGQQL